MNTSKKYIVSFVLSVFARTHAAEKHFNMIFFVPNEKFEVWNYDVGSSMSLR